ncbi:MAG: arsenic resistance N-acetyltransferase ArsN2 [Gammaproteobacteria bacterium]|nr:arsenic resistance N-acetyltransferase ArsN2 [Gammaproteobacteria bacterium]
MDPSFRNARASDLGAIREALGAAGLPTQGVGGAGEFFICEADGAFRGAAGVEVYGNDALLRSLVVAPEARRLGLGRRLCEQAVKRARDTGCRAVYLLTLDATEYFARLGFEIVARDQAPAGIQSSGEFSSHCPDSAVLMRRRIEP